MISLSTECLLFKLLNGESVPLSAGMISVELGGGDPVPCDPDFVQHAAGAVFEYFKHELAREAVTVAEFAGALEKVLMGLGLQGGEGSSGLEQRSFPGADLCGMAAQAGKGFELVFFQHLRQALREQLHQSPDQLRFCGLRDCVKYLTGARRWCPRCQSLRDQIVDFLRSCLSAEAGGVNCCLLLE